MINFLNNSSQPFLFKQLNNDIYILYCFSDTLQTRYFGSDSYRFKPWIIKGINLSTHDEFIVFTEKNHETYGTVVIECNPHLSVDQNGNGKLYYTAGFAINDTSPISYYICCMTINNFNFSNLTNFSVLYPAFTGIQIDENEYIYANKYDFRPQERLTRINVLNHNQSTYDIIFDEILRLVPLYDEDNFIVTGKINDTNISYLLNNDFTVNKVITNQNNENIYKSSILKNDNLLAYTKINSSAVEDRSIIIENINF